MSTQITSNITDVYTSMHEHVYGIDDEDTVTPEPGHLYTTESAPILFYFASDKTWWTIDEDTGATAPAEEPAHIEPGDVDMAFFESWQDTALADWSDLMADQARIDQAKEAIETTLVGYAGVIGRDDWGVCIVATDTIAQVTGALPLDAQGYSDNPEETLKRAKVYPVTRRYKASWKLDEGTVFTLRTINDTQAVDLTDGALGAW